MFQVDGGDGCVAPGRDTIADGTYPLSRTLYIYVNKGKIAENPALQAVRGLLPDRRGLVAAVTAVQYVALPADQIEATRTAWESAQPTSA